MRHLLGLFPMKPVRCPCCRLRIDGEHVWVYRSCVVCGAALRIRRRFFWTTYVLAFVASGGIAFAVGNRGTAATVHSKGPADHPRGHRDRDRSVGPTVVYHIYLAIEPFFKTL